MTEHCPDCGVALEIRKAGGVSKSMLSFWDRLRRPSQKQTRYYQDAPWIQPITQPQPTGALNPNETVWRPLSAQADIDPQDKMARKCGGYVAVLLACAASARYFPPSQPLAIIIGVADIVAGAVFVRLNWDLLWKKDPENDRLVTRERGSEQPETSAASLADLNVNLTAEIATNETGSSTLSTKVTLSARQVRKWREFCEAVTAGECHFSGNAAEAAGVDRVWFEETLLPRWVNEDPKLALVFPESVKPRKTPRLTPYGERMVATFASSTLPEVVTLLEGLSGDR